MKRKIDLFWYWFILVVAFVLCFFCINDKKVNAYNLDSNGNLVSYNLFDINKYVAVGGTANYSVEDNKLILVTPNLSTDVFIGQVTHYENAQYYINVSENTDYVISFVRYTDIEVFSLAHIFVSFVDYNNNVIEFLPLEWEAYNIDRQYLHFVTPVGTSKIFIRFGYQIPTLDTSVYVSFEDIMLTQGTSYLEYELFGVWYNPFFAESLYGGSLPKFRSYLTYTNENDGLDYSINDVNSYIDNSFGYLYFDRLWSYLDNITGSSYSNAFVNILFNENLNINTSYIINSTKQNYGSGVMFYQGDVLMLDVRNFYDNNYCGGAVQYTCNVELNKYVNIGTSNNSFSYLNKISVWSASTDERTLTFGYNNIGYNIGYDNGYLLGYNDGKNVSSISSYNDGYTNGYNVGYDKGVNYASNGGNTLVGLVGAIFTSPVNMLQTIFDFEFLGINLTNFLFSLISLFIVIWLIRKFL